MCLYDDGEHYGITFSDEHRTARKEHKCYECLRVIDVGERYRYTSGKYDGMVQEYKVCAHCEASIEVVVSITGCPRFYYLLELWSGDYEIGFIADAFQHPLPREQKRVILNLWRSARRKWRTKTGELKPIPAIVPT